MEKAKIKFKDWSIIWLAANLLQNKLAFPSNEISSNIAVADVRLFSMHNNAGNSTAICNGYEYENNAEQ